MNDRVKELLKEIEQLKDENKKYKEQKKYGLVWENEKNKEQVVEDCRNKLPILERVKSKEIITDKNKPMNIMIEGDNYHSLSCLNYTHREKIDVIYIDPPYNTGKKDEWKYNDKYIDKEDRFRHSKWLNMMNSRLKLAHSLLSDNGIIFISIDDNEQANLKVLCDEIFGEHNFTGNAIWNKKNVVQNDAKFMSINHEYLLTYRKSNSLESFNLLPRTEEMNARYSNPDNDPRGDWTSVALQAKSGRDSNLYEITFDNGVKWKPVNGTFPRLNKDSLKKAYEEGRLWFGKKGTNVPRLKKYLSEVKQGVVSNSIWLNSDVGSTQKAKEDLKRILGKNIFETPKPFDLIKRCLELNSNKSAVILDFFAGSGTTAQAVLDLNKEDGGNRKFIVCTNNEGKIAEEVCYPRIEKVIKGYNKNGNGEFIEGLGGNLHYFKADENSFISVDNLKAVDDKKKLDLTYNAGELIAIKENIFNETERKQHWQIFEDDKRQVAIYFSETEIHIDELLSKMDEKKEKIVYLFNWGKNTTTGDELGYPDITIKDIPQPIINIYQELNKD